MSIIISDAPRSFLRFATVCNRIGLSKSTIRRLQAEGRVPRCYRIGRSAIAFLSTDIEGWIDSRVAEPPPPHQGPVR